MPTPQITAITLVPQNGQAPSVFNTNTNSFVGAMVDFQTQANAQADFNNDKAAEVAADAEAVALSEPIVTDARDETVAARDVVVPLSVAFGASYLGASDGAPTEDGNGDPLADGMLYTETTTSPGLKLRLGGNWVAAAVDAAGAVLVANNLSDVDAAASRGNLDLTFPTKAQAEAGTQTTGAMTPLRVAQAIAALGQTNFSRTEYLSSGTWIKPAGAQFVIIEAWGGGESGAGGGTRIGGGAGAFARAFLMADDLAGSEAITIGAGGAAKTGGDTGTSSGGDTTFGTHVTAKGGGWNGTGSNGHGELSSTGTIISGAGGNNQDGGSGTDMPGGGGGRLNLGGLSVNAGNGGDGGNTGEGFDGDVPGGGGGASFNTKSNGGGGGSGGAGKMIITVIG